jgi:predicted nucleotidyltransferase
MKIKNKKNQLLSFVSEFATHTKCVVIYGSSSIKSKDHISSNSDIDIFIVFKHATDIYREINHFQALLNETDIIYDLCWYIDQYFEELLQKNIDLMYFNNIFSEGEILFGKSYVSKIIKFVSNCRICSTYKVTVDHRLEKNNSCKISLAKNLSRILYDYIANLYSTKQLICQLNQLPTSDALVKNARDLMLIDDQVHEMYFQLREICKIRSKQIDKYSSNLTELLAEYEQSVHALIKLDA